MKPVRVIHFEYRRFKFTTGVDRRMAAHKRQMGRDAQVRGTVTALRHAMTELQTKRMKGLATHLLEMRNRSRCRQTLWEEPVNVTRAVNRAKCPECWNLATVDQGGPASIRFLPGVLIVFGHDTFARNVT